MNVIMRTLVCGLIMGAGLAWQGPGQSEDRQPARFRADVDQVVLYASVYDRNGELVSDLTRDQFRVFEDKVEQEITSFGLVDVATTLGVVMDRSGSMRSKMDLVNRATELFLSKANPENELFLISFDDEIEVEEPFTYDMEDIRDALDNIVPSGGTALYDAIYLSVDHCRDGHEVKKVIVVFTDGEDKDSYYSVKEVLDKVQEADVQVYLVAFLDEELDDESGFFGIFKSEREKVIKSMTELAEYTGGKAFFPTEMSELDGVFDAIARELRNQYRLAYISGNQAHDGAWRRVRVELEGARQRELKVRARRGYYAPGDSE